MKARVFSLSYSPFFIITSISVLAAITYLNKGLGLMLGSIIAIASMWASDFSDFNLTGRKVSYLNQILNVIWALLGAIGISLMISLGFVSLGYAGIIETPILGFPRIGVHWFLFLSIAALIGFCTELILRGYLQSRLSYIFGDSQFSGVLTSFILSTLVGLIFSSHNINVLLKTVYSQQKSSFQLTFRSCLVWCLDSFSILLF